jgi:hypothetical protein
MDERMNFDYDSDPWNPGPGPIGAAHTISHDTGYDAVVEHLRAVVAEVTGKPVEPVPPHTIGFY